jgi:Prolyl oligopeptidase family/short chain dehydrogenase/WD40-like Beta Propeller Repeat
MSEVAPELTAELIADSAVPMHPVISPDGRWVAYVVTTMGVRERRLSALWVAPADASSPPTRLTAGQAWMGAPRWAPDSASLLFGSDRELHRIRPDGGGAETLISWRGEIFDYLPLAGGRSVAVIAGDEPGAEDERRQAERDDAMVWGEHVPGSRLWLLDLGSRELVVVGGLGDRHVVEVVQRPELRAISWGTQERLSYQASDGLTLDAVLILPAGKSREDGPFPLITLVHGGHYDRYADEFMLGWWPCGQWLATAGYAVFLPNPRGSQGHGHEFAVAVAGAVGTDEWTDILSGIDLLIASGVADPDRLGIGGWSHGGFMAAWAVGQTGRFRGALMGAGICDWGMQVGVGELGTQESGSRRQLWLGEHRPAPPRPAQPDLPRLEDRYSRTDRARPGRHQRAGRTGDLLPPRAVPVRGRARARHLPAGRTSDHGAQSPDRPAPQDPRVVRPVARDAAMISSPVTLITGGSSGIGAAAAGRLLSQGHRVAITGRDPGRLDRLAAELGQPTGLLALAGDASDYHAVQSAVESTLREFGRLDLAQPCEVPRVRRG